MAGPGKFEDLHLDDLSLEPLPDPNLLNYAAPKKQGQVKMSGRNNKVTDRRVNPDRRLTPRFEPNRRSGKERRPNKSWGPSGTNI